jgi:beta-lactamase regulating signal transducer with metallopeptidase domain
MRSALIYNFLIEANIMASIAILLMIPLRKLFRKQLGNSAICFGWLLVAIRLLCPLSLPNPFIREIRPAFLSDETIRPIAGQIKVRLVDAIGDVGRLFWQAGNKEGYSRMQAAADGVDYNGYPQTIAWIILIGTACVLLWFGFSNIRFRKKLRAGRIEEISGGLKEMYLNMCKERKVRPVPVYFTDPVPGACLVGVFRPFIVLPVITAPEDVKNVLTHEICHLKNRDHIWNILRMLCCAIHWFNPLVWLAASMSRTDSELRCDDRVTEAMDEQERKDYANVLVYAAARKSMPGIGVMATGMTMTGKRLKNRVLGVIQNRKPIRAFAFVFMAVAFTCLVGAFATSETGLTWLTSFPNNYEANDWTLDQEMLQYYAEDREALDSFGVGVWESASLKENSSHTPFSLKSNDEGTEWIMTDSGGELILVYDGQGTLISLLNNKSGVDDSTIIPLTALDTPMEKMTELYPDQIDEIVGEYVSHFLYSFRPDLISGSNYVQLLEQWKHGSNWFAVFALRRTVMDVHEDQYLAMIELQMYPEIRVVRMTTVQDQMKNPGNG